MDRRWPTTVSRLATAWIVLSLTAAGCGSDGGGPIDGQGDHPGLTVTAEDVQLADGIVRLDETAVRDQLAAVGASGQLIFKADAPSAGGVEAGDVLLLEGVAPRRVTGVDRSGDQLVVRTEDAAITDVVTDGRLGWTYDIAWDELPESVYETAAADALEGAVRVAAAGEPDGRLLPGLAQVRGKELKFTGTVKGFEVELKFVPKSDKLEFEVSAKRSNVKVQAAGFVSRFTSAAQMEFDQGTGTLFSTDVTGLRGEVEVTWNAFQVEDPSLNSDIVAFEIPFSLPIPITVGPLPLTINVKTNIRVVPELTSGNASSGGAWKLTYDADQGFTSNGGDPTPRSTLRTMAADLGSEPTVTAGLGVTGFGAGVEFPRLELQLGHPILPELYQGDDADTKSALEKAASLLRPYAFLTFNQFINGLWTPGTTLTADIPPCQRSSLTMSAIAGYKLSVLGMVELSDTKLLWQKVHDKFKDDRPCTLTGE